MNNWPVDILFQMLWLDSVNINLCTFCITSAGTYCSTEVTVSICRWQLLDESRGESARVWSDNKPGRWKSAAAAAKKRGSVRLSRSVNLQCDEPADLNRRTADKSPTLAPFRHKSAAPHRHNGWLRLVSSSGQVSRSKVYDALLYGILKNLSLTIGRVKMTLA